MNPLLIRNFCIIAHINHGKSTIADCILEMAHAVSAREMKSQFLDSMELEQELGITIKLNSVTFPYYDPKRQTTYTFNLIDTPGHVDFTYEVSRSIAACDGAILVVDASQGVQAQTIANLNLALEQNLVIIPIINKIDLKTADVVRTQEAIYNLFDNHNLDIPLVSAKHKTNINLILDKIIQKIPPPRTTNDQLPLKALIFDSAFDPYKKVILMVKIVSGTLHSNEQLLLMADKKKFNAIEIGITTPVKKITRATLKAGEIGWIYSSIKTAKEVTIGDTVTSLGQPALHMLPGYKEMQPMVFCDVFPIDANRFGELKTGLEKISLSDASFVFSESSSLALGFGFRCGFLGTLHMDIIRERIEREFNLALIAIAPSVIYKVTLTNGNVVTCSNPSDLPVVQKIKTIEEPIVQINFLVSDNAYLGSLMNLCHAKRGKYLGMQFISDTTQLMEYEMPLNEIIFSFFSQVKALSQGYISFNYQFVRFQPAKLVKVDILLKGEKIDALSSIFHITVAQRKGRELCKKLKEVIPRENFEIPIQAAINHQVIARETVKAVRKDVTAKLYGGDVSRKRKLLAKQKKGKKRLKKFGSVHLSQEAFLAVLKIN